MFDAGHFPGKGITHKRNIYVLGTNNGMYFIRTRTWNARERAGMEDGEMMLKRYKWLCFDFILKGRGNQ